MQSYRHGDLIFKPVSKIDRRSLKKMPLDIIKSTVDGAKKKFGFTLALGEVTGHKHVMVADKKDDLKVYQDTFGRFVIDVAKETTLSHEEHAPLTFTPGIYLMEIEREHDYFQQSARQVYD